jgi:hypothetical protein
VGYWRGVECVVEVWIVDVWWRDERGVGM